MWGTFTADIFHPAHIYAYFPNKDSGMDPIQFGVMIVMNLSIGTITPPVGNVLFVGCSVARLQVEDVMKKLLPFFIAIVAALMFITFVPGFSMWLPGVLGLLK